MATENFFNGEGTFDIARFIEVHESLRMRVLTRLATAGEQEKVGGAEMARAFGVSRNAVWKVVEELRADGERIESDREGYTLHTQGYSYAALRRGSRSVSPLFFAESLPSTNDIAKRLAERGYPAGTAVVCDRQSAGRGRRSRSFHSPAGCGVYLSMILRPSCTAEKGSSLTTCAAVAVADAVEQTTSLHPSVKWVNDLYLDGRKAAGILSEGATDFESGTLSYAVVGVGVNVLHTDFPAGLADIATTLYDAGAHDIDRTEFAVALLNALSARLLAFDGNDCSYMDDYRRRCAVIGRMVTVCRGTETYRAKALAVTDGGELVVRTEDGETRTLCSGEVSVRM